MLFIECLRRATNVRGMEATLFIICIWCILHAFLGCYGFVQMEKFTCETVHFIYEIRNFHILNLSFTYFFACESKVLCKNNFTPEQLARGKAFSYVLDSCNFPERICCMNHKGIRQRLMSIRSIINVMTDQP